MSPGKRQAFQTGLLRIAIALLVSASICVAIATAFGAQAGTASALLAAAAIAIGFVPLRLVARHGIEMLPAVWMASTGVRLVAAIAAVVLLVAGRGMKAEVVMAGVIGTYLVLLTVETVGLSRLVRSLDDLND